MKKWLCLFLAVCVLLPCLAACGNGDGTGENTQTDGVLSFASEEEMSTYLEGVWKVAVDGKDCFYVFQKGQLLYTDAETFNNKASQYIDSLMTRNGAEILSGLDYQAFLDYGEVLTALENVTLVPEEGKVYIHKDQKFGKCLSFFPEKALIKESYVDYDLDLTKISDNGDLNATYFTDIYKAKISSVTIEMKNLVKPQEYLTTIADYYRDTNKWKLFHEDESSQWYSDSGTTNNDGYYIITDQSLLYARDRNYLDDKYQVSIDYYADPSNEMSKLTITNNLAGLFSTLQLAHPALSKYPGALSVEELYKKFSAEKKMTYGFCEYKETINEIEYNLMEHPENETCLIVIRFPSKISLAEYLDALEKGELTIPEETVPETTAPSETEPETTVPVQEVKQNGNWTWHNLDLDMNLEYYFTEYAFTEDGTCYLLVMKGEDIIKKGVGTYTVNDNRISITIDGKTTIYDFVYNEDTNAYICTLGSDEKPIEWWNAETKITFNSWREDDPFMLPMEEIVEKAQQKIVNKDY